jgi:citrate lyase beta subunit
MPPLLQQARAIPPGARRPLLVRWLLRAGDNYEAAGARYQPFDRLREEDPENRSAIATLVAKAHAHGVPALITVNNTAEGCAPDGIALLAQALVARLEATAA